MPAKLYKHKPSHVRAIQWTGKNLHEILEVFGANGIFSPTESNQKYLVVTQSDGTRGSCFPGDWIIQDVRPGTFMICNDKFFQKKYEFVMEHDAP